MRTETFWLPCLVLLVLCYIIFGPDPQNGRQPFDWVHKGFTSQPAPPGGVPLSR